MPDILTSDTFAGATFPANYLAGAAYVDRWDDTTAGQLNANAGFAKLVPTTNPITSAMWESANNFYGEWELGFNSLANNHYIHFPNSREVSDPTYRIRVQSNASNLVTLSLAVYAGVSLTQDFGAIGSVTPTDPTNFTVAAVYDHSAQTIALYIDGVQIGSTYDDSARSPAIAATEGNWWLETDTSGDTIYGWGVGTETAAGDTEAPTMGTATRTLVDTWTVAVNDQPSGGNVRLFGVVVPSGDTTPTADQIAAGTDASDVAAPSYDSGVVAGGTLTMQISGFPTTEQKLCYFSQDDESTPNRTGVSTLTIPAVGAAASEGIVLPLPQTLIATVPSSTTLTLTNRGSNARYVGWELWNQDPANSMDLSQWRVTADDGTTLTVQALDATVRALTVSDVVYLLPSRPEVTATMAANGLNAAAIASDAVTTLQAGLSRSSEISAVDTNVDSVRTVTDGLQFTETGYVDVAVRRADGILRGTASGTPTTTTVALTGVSVSYDSQYVGKRLEYLTGPAAHYPVDITGSVASGNVLTHGALPATPSAGNLAIIY